MSISCYLFICSLSTIQAQTVSLCYLLLVQLRLSLSLGVTLFTCIIPGPCGIGLMMLIDWDNCGAGEGESGSQGLLLVLKYQ